MYGWDKYAKRLQLNDDGVIKDVKSVIFIMKEWKVIQEIFLKVDYNMKVHMKEQLQKITYPESTNMKPPVESIKTKSAHKKVKPTHSDNFNML